MDAFWKQIIWQQFGATVDMLENAMRACPDELWSDPSKKPEWVSRDVVGFWYLVFHTLFWLDYYLSESEEGFAPPAPFTLDEFDPVGLLPERPYTKEELLRYLEHDRRKCRARIAGLTEEGARARRKFFGSAEGTFAELLLYNMRHVQHHTAQLNLMLRRETDSAPNWVGRTPISLR
jgi:hypothetical protein